VVDFDVVEFLDVRRVYRERFPRSVAGSVLT